MENSVEEKVVPNEKNCPNNDETISESGKKLVSLIVKIIVNATLRECYEKGDKVS